MWCRAESLDGIERHEEHGYEVSEKDEEVRKGVRGEGGSLRAFQSIMLRGDFGFGADFPRKRSGMAMQQQKSWMKPRTRMVQAFSRSLALHKSQFSTTMRSQGEKYNVNGRRGQGREYKLRLDKSSYN